MTKSDRGELTPAYILHTRLLGDTSVILEMLTEREGRVAAVMKGGRSRKAGALQPFTPLLVAYSGRGELKTVTKVEPGSVILLRGEQLFIGMYLNELLMRLLGKFERCPELFSAYQAILLQLLAGEDNRTALRRFELRLLQFLGYGITFKVDTEGREVLPESVYRFVADEGFHLAIAPGFLGKDLLLIDAGDLSTPGAENSARKITRSALARLLGGRPLKSRELYRQFQQAKGSV